LRKSLEKKMLLSAMEDVLAARAAGRESSASKIDVAL
jgi:hypothetical protein